MKKSLLLSKLSLLIFTLVAAANAATSNITATVQDPNGQVFANGTVTATFVPNPNSASSTYTSGGLTFPQTVTGTLNGSGTFTIAITDNLTVSPGLSQWNITVCPQASTQCSQYIGTVTGASPNLSTQINAIVPIIQVQPNIFTFVFAYADNEIVGPRVGTVYYNTITNQAKIYNGATWSALVGGITSAWASGGVSSGVLCKSNGAGLCLDSSITDNGVNVIGTLVFLAPDGGYAFSGNTAMNISRSGNTLLVGASNMAISTAAHYITLRSDGTFAFSSNTNPDSSGDVIIGRRGPANLRLGAADVNGVPVPQTLSQQGAITGSNLPGSNFVLQISNGTGSGGGGSFIIQTGVPHGSDGVADTFTTGFSVDKNQLVTAPVSFSSPHVAATTDLAVGGSQVQTGTQGSTGAKLFSCTGTFTSGNYVKTDANGNCVDGGSVTSAFKVEVVDNAAHTGTTVAATTLQTFSLTANEITTNQELVWETWGTWANGAGAGSPTVVLKIDGTAVCTMSIVTAGASQGPIGWHAVYSISATSTSAAEVHCHLASATGNSTVAWNSNDANTTTKAIDFTTTRSLTNTVNWDIAATGGWIQRSSTIMRRN